MSIGRLVNTIVGRSIRLVCLCLSQSVGRPVGRSAGRSACLSVSRSVSRLVGRSIYSSWLVVKEMPCIACSGTLLPKISRRPGLCTSQQLRLLKLRVPSFWWPRISTTHQLKHNPSVAMPTLRRFPPPPFGPHSHPPLTYCGSHYHTILSPLEIVAGASSIRAWRRLRWPTSSLPPRRWCSSTFSSRQSTRTATWPTC